MASLPLLYLVLQENFWAKINTILSPFIPLGVGGNGQILWITAHLFTTLAVCVFAGARIDHTRSQYLANPSISDPQFPWVVNSIKSKSAREIFQNSHTHTHTPPQLEWPTLPLCLGPGGFRGLGFPMGKLGQVDCPNPREIFWFGLRRVWLEEQQTAEGSSSLWVQFCSSRPSSQSLKPSQTRGPCCLKELELQAGLRVTGRRTGRKLVSLRYQWDSLMTSSAPQNVQMVKMT